VLKYAGLSPKKAAEVMTVPEGFEVKLFAGEPDVRQPIAMCLDDRGRLWVAEAYSYPVRRPDKEAKDRIVIFEDTKGTGSFDKRTVFMEGLNLVSGLEVGFGGVWIGAAPYLLYVPIKEGEDKPAGPAQTLLDGWAYQDTHETLNTFSWGPDGWLYGCHGVFTHSRVGKPGTLDAQRAPINAGIWRYHPTRHVFEVFAHGTSNPWGFDFDDRGQAFCEACVIPHCFHIIQGGRYLRQAGSHFNPYTYADIQTIADHLHWQGANQWAANNRSDKMGGGHAHCGLMIYLGDTWPAEYRGKLFMGNIHGRRLNVDVPKVKGSGYTASHGTDFLLANDASARFINLRYGPDGNVYLLDWYDKQACHHNDVNIWDRDTGRIYKICYRGVKDDKSVANASGSGVDLTKKTDQELADLQMHLNDWYVRHARRLLQERAAHKAIDDGALVALSAMAIEQKDETRRLRALWALHAVGALTLERVQKALSDEGPYVRAWAIQLALETSAASDALLKRLTELAVKDPSAVVRLYLASGLQRLPLEKRWEILEALTAHKEDSEDPNIPLLIWYALEPLAAVNAERALALATHSPMPPLFAFMVRRIGSTATPKALALLVKPLGQAKDVAQQKTILIGIQEALRGRTKVDMPEGWSDVFTVLAKSSDAEVRSRAVALAVTFGDSKAFDILREVLANRAIDLAQRQSALTALLGARDKQLPPILLQLLREPALRGAALRALASFDDARTAQEILAVYPTLSVEEKRDALNALASRAAYGKALMDAVAAKKVVAADIPAEIIRQLRNLNDKALDQRIADVWGLVRSTPADRLKLIAEWKRKLQTPAADPDLAQGRAIFAKTCQQCHTLYGIGGKVGPDITGSNRANLDYLLENILDPSAVIPNDYKVTILGMKSGRVVTGIVKAETGAALTVALANETLTVPKDEVETREPSQLSMMPEDLLKPLTDAEIRSLIAYLRNPAQTPILATADNVKDFFNGKDLTGWNGDPKLWHVENGEIVGKSPGIAKNEFLTSHVQATDFRLTLQVKLVPNKENSGVQFRSEALEGGEMRGPQADIGAGWWGKLYEENGRGILWDKSGEKHVKVDEWNTYKIEARGSRVRTWINAQLCVDVEDAKISRRGIFGLQIHAGGPMEVRFKDLKLEVLPSK
jgi:putative membrane-bound dehydrogenase-like protein